MATIELAGLELHGFHGVLDAERRDGQRFLYDVWLEVAEPERDEIEAALDYREVVAIVREVADARAYRLLESLAAAVADALLERLAAERRGREQVAVVSSDTAVLGTSGIEVRKLSSQTFLAELARPRQAAGPRGDLRDRLDPATLAALERLRRGR